MSRAESVDSLADVHPPSPRRRTWRFWVGVPLLLIAVWLLLLFVFFRYRTSRDLREAMAEADRREPDGWQLDDLEAQREKVPDEENAALVVVKVKQLLPLNWPIVPQPQQKDEGGEAAAFGLPLTWDLQLHELPPEIQLDEALWHGLRASLARAAPARAEARKLIGMTRGRFPLEWDDNPLLTTVNSQDARAAANLLRYEAADRSQDGDADGALANVRGLLGAARLVGDEPLLISILIRIACDAQALLALERALAQGEPSARELEAMQALLAEEEKAPLMYQGMRGERAGMHKMLVSMRQGNLSLAQVTGATGGMEKKLLDLGSPTLARRSHASFLRLMNEYVEAAQLPPEDQAPVMKALERKVIQAKIDYDAVTALMMPAVIKVSDAYRRGLGNLRCALVAVALERYRHDHGRWPDKLDALVPKYLAAVPKDAGDGAPLRLKRLPDGVLVYWTGNDGVDDGGAINRRNWLAKGSDQGFRLWDVAHRRQPAAEMLPPPAEGPP